jgi:tetratricopeptide (TPR) repeat protein
MKYERADLPLYPAADAYGWQKFPQAEAVNAFARGVGAAMNKDPAKARAELARLQQIRETAAALKINYWVEQIDIQSDVVRALTTYAEGKHDEAIAMLRKAAEREEATEKHVVTPGLIAPAREVLGRVMLEVGKPADALREFEAVIEREPNRYRAFAGAVDAAERAGDAKKTAHHSARLIELTANADTPRAEIAQAKRLLGK